MAIAAMVLVFIGQEWERGLAMLEEAQRANPNSPTVLSLYGIANVMQGNLLAGRAAYLRALAISPAALDNYELLLGVALSHLVAGEYGHLERLDEGHEIVARLLAKSPAMRLSHVRDIGEREAVVEGLRKAGLPE